MKKKIPLWIFFILTAASFLTAVVFTVQLTFPFITTKAFFFRAIIELAFPIYAYLLLVEPKLRPNLKNPLTVAVLAFLLINLLAALWGVNLRRSFWGYYERMGGVWQLMHMTLLYFYILLFVRADSKFLRWLLNVLIVISSFTVLYGINARLGGPQLFPDFSLPTRVSSFFGNPIFFASFLILPAALAAFFALQAQTRLARWLYWAAVLLQLVGIYLSGTRGAVVGLAVGLLTGALIYLSRQSRRKVKLLGISAIVLLMAAITIVISLHRHFAPDSSLWHLTNFSDSNTQSRLLQWKTALKGFRDRPVLGVGPENYYVISDKYFSPEFYHLDSSWFDKPHNYPLEVLTTAGLGGLLSYLAIIVFSLWAAVLAFRKQLIGLGELAVLAAGVTAYFVQNLFVFDTVTASLAFFVFTGFAGFLWSESSAALPADSPPLAPAASRFALPFGPATVALVVLYAGVCYSLYLTIWSPAKISQDINYGLTITTHDPAAALSFFDDAKRRPFTFAPGDLATKYSDLVATLSLLPNSNVSSEQMGQEVSDAFNLMQKAATQAKNNPIYWYTLTNMYMVKANFFHTGLDSQAEAAAQAGVNLVPDRIQNLYYLAQVKLQRDDPKSALQILEKTAHLAPNIPDTSWWLALAYKQLSDLPDAVTLAESALAKGYQLKTPTEFQWLTNYYAEQKNYPRVLQLYQQAVIMDPNNFQLRANLATAYAAVGDKANARAQAQKVLELNPQMKDQVDSFLQSLR